MGREAFCTAIYGTERAEGKAHLDTDALTFRGGFRLDIPFLEMEAVEAVNGELRMEFRGKSAAFRLGKDSDAWADRILNPPSLMKKLGVKSGITVAVVGPHDPSFDDQLVREGAEVVGHAALANIVFLRVEDPNDLGRVHDLKRRIPADGAIWIITPRGRKDLSDVVVMTAGKVAGLVDNKTCRFSDTHTALRFVIRKADRPFHKP